MIAFHYPPQRGSSGIQRTLRFARYLPEFGWEPHILTVHRRAYAEIDADDDAPPDVAVHRAFALDTARHLAVRNRYPGFLARPDRWISWWCGAVPLGLSLVRRLRPAALWSTYPIATAHAIGHTLARLSGLPWVADFRDPMAQDGYPPDPATWRSFRRIEARTIARAARSVFTTQSAAARYRARYPSSAARIAIIENGYDEESFADLARPPVRGGSRALLLLHSGIVYPSERDPSALIAALGTMCNDGRIVRGELVLRFRAPVHDALLRDLAARHGVSEFVDIAPPLPYRAALAEMLAADGLVVLQAANCDEQIPAKLYEYFRAGRPMLGFANPAGDTGRALHAMGVRHIAALEDATAIADTLASFVADLRAGRLPVPDPARVRAASRRERTHELARLLDQAG